MDNEYAHLYYYGAGTVFGDGITSTYPGVFENVQADNYWSSTGSEIDTAWSFYFTEGMDGGDHFSSGKLAGNSFA